MYTFVGICYPVLFLLFLFGVISLFSKVKKPEKGLRLLRIALILVLFAHSSAYILSGVINIKFGWQRNLFYFLPVYFLVIFYFLKQKIKSKGKYYYICICIVLFILVLSIQNIFSWTDNNLLREMVGLAGRSKGFSLVISERNIDRWSFKYYAKDFKAQSSVVFVPSDINNIQLCDATQGLAYYIDGFRVIQAFPDNFLYQECGNILDRYSFEIIDKKDYEVQIGPYLLLKKIIGYPSEHIRLYVYRKKQ